jgi:D-arginine dehydrogenase
MSDLTCDFLVIGAGAVGLSIAASLSSHGSVIVAEPEDHHSYHSTGRSAAVLVDSYGSENVHALTAASRNWFQRNADDLPFLKPRGLLCVALKAEKDPSFISISDVFPREYVSVNDALALVPILNEDCISQAWLEPNAADIDVHMMQTEFMRTLRGNGGTLLCGHGVREAVPNEGGWRVAAGDTWISTGHVVNAAGAWAADVARLFGASEVSLTPLLRTAATIDLESQVIPPDWPLVLDVGESIYFKPDAGSLMLSPADERQCDPMDAFPEDLDVAIAIDRFEKLTTASVSRLRSKWAGLRTFAPDKDPVVGADPRLNNFFWAAGLGGCGIQTAPGLGAFAASLIVRCEPSVPIENAGSLSLRLSPARFELS